MLIITRESPLYINYQIAYKKDATLFLCTSNCFRILWLTIKPTVCLPKSFIFSVFKFKSIRCKSAHLGRNLV
jgi:hypothetical protein